MSVSVWMSGCMFGYLSVCLGVCVCLDACLYGLLLLWMSGLLYVWMAVWMFFVCLAV